MKKIILSAVIIIIFLSSCSPYVSVGSGGKGKCGAFAPRQFENDRAWKRHNNWVNNPRSGRYRSGF